MKKILATLLVATMLLSCMTFVGFAAKPVVSTVGEYPFAGLTEMDEDAWELNPAVTFYINNITAVTGLKKPSDKRTSPIYVAAEITTKYFNEESDVLGVVPTSAVPADYVIIPVMVDGAGTEQIGVKATFDSNYLTPYIDKAMMGATVAEMNSGALVVSSLNDSPVAGTHFYLIFTINPEAKGDPGLTTATTTINLNVVEDDDFDIGNQTVNVKLSGLAIGDAEPEEPEEPAEKEDVTVDDVAQGTASLVVPTKGGYDAANWASESFANIEDNVSAEDKADAEKYSCAFATVDLTDKNYDAVGFALIAEDGTGVRFFEAKKVSATGAYGVVFFGTEQVLGWYKVAPAVKLNGEIIYDANNASEL